MSESSATAELHWTGFRQELFASYSAFARREFGRFAYQGKPEYVRWLYAENPVGVSEESDFLVGVRNDGQVVACVHKLRIPWHIAGATVNVPALHNLMAAPGYRRGIGALLILSALAKDKYAIVLGARGEVSQAYERLGSRRVEAAWYRWILNPVTGAFRISMGALGRETAGWPVDSRLPILRHLFPSLILETRPPRTRVEELASLLGSGDQEDRAAPSWTPELVEWRFFHPLGPKHLLVESRTQDFVALVSLGRHRGARVARIVELRATRPESCRAGLGSLRSMLRLLGGDVLIGFCADTQTRAVLSEAGNHPEKNDTDTWFYVRRRAPAAARVAFFGAVGDFGFDAI